MRPDALQLINLRVRTFNEHWKRVTQRAGTPSVHIISILYATISFPLLFFLAASEAMMSGCLPPNENGKKGRREEKLFVSFFPPSPPAREDTEGIL